MSPPIEQFKQVNQDTPEDAPAAEIALLRAMRRNRNLVGQYARWPEAVAMLKKEIAWGCEAFVENDESRMARITERMMGNLEALHEYGHLNPENT